MASVAEGGGQVGWGGGVEAIGVRLQMEARREGGQVEEGVQWES